MNISSIIPDLIMDVEEYYNCYYERDDVSYFNDNYVSRIALKNGEKEGRIYLSKTKKMDRTDIISYSQKTQENYKFLENAIFYFVVIQDITKEDNTYVPDVVFNTLEEATAWLKSSL